MQTEQEAFSFELSETLYFDKGQEVSEMISISLDPEISIQSFNDYVSIRGVIELNGQYTKEEERINQDDPLDLEELHSKRFIERVDENDEGYQQFAHRFPVEISVPKYRITDTNNVTVGIEAFDYELPSENQLKIKAMIHIHGILSHQDERAISEQTDEQEEMVTEDQIDEDSFAFEVEVRDEDKQPPTYKHATTDSELPTVEAVEQDHITDNEKQLSIPEAYLIEESSSAETDLGFEEDHPHDHIDVHTHEQERDEDSESEDRDDFNFLATLFHDKDVERETYANMRICIVQENDTLETIAERYHVSKLHILKLNRLEDDDLEEGQLLSIPEKKSKNT